MQTNVKPMNLVGFQRFLIISLGLRTESSCKPSLRLPQKNESLLFVFQTGCQLPFICNCKDRLGSALGCSEVDRKSDANHCTTNESHWFSQAFGNSIGLITETIASLPLGWLRLTKASTALWLSLIVLVCLCLCLSA